ncbi:CCR4-NOT transcription complex subunit 11-like [Sycon ciliatum]|uniref:CCR4-NOT transcription complex subunit 11-like n=1 Tax=Sycon ciliatum TaxID=27933 RepID=UPI0020AC87DB|eukprot:scpid61870/ scgid9958/ UPF0760 protein C2orf29
MESPCLSRHELTTLLQNVLSENAMGASLEVIWQHFNREFPKADHFRIGESLMLLLAEPDLLSSSAQRIGAMSILFSVCSEPVESNPFAPFFAQLLQCPSSTPNSSTPPLASPQEKAFLARLVTGPTRELFKESCRYIASADVSAINYDYSKIASRLCQAQKSYPPRVQVGRSCVIADPGPDTQPGRPDSQAVWMTAEQLFLGDSRCLGTFEPPMLRPPPPLHTVEDELMWLNPPMSPPSIQWDYTMCIPVATTQETETELKQVLQDACRSVLNPQQQNFFLSKLEADPDLIYHIGLTPKKLPKLIEYNPLVAIEVLLKLTTTSAITDYFGEIITMEMSLHSMEVVNRLTTLVELPNEFIHLYISNCISQCEKVKEKYMQNRLVRLVCVFLQSMIRNRHCNIQEIFIEVQAFCIEFSRIREAAGLFRLLKSYEEGTLPAAESNSGVTSLAAAAAAAAAASSGVAGAMGAASTDSNT